MRRLSDDPLWYKDAILYEVHVRAFHDSNGDGIGDFPGLTQKLDYLQDLGISALWLLPFYPSPLRDGGYDIADYTGIHPDYGTMDEFLRFLEQAHRRGLRVITELVLNHTSSDHSWFQRARRSPAGSTLRDFYVWSDSPERYRSARIIFQDFEKSNWTWDTIAKAYYWHRFYSHQPDLNFDNPAVHDAVLSVLETWLGLGVDGVRLDAIPYLYEREGTACENLPETHAFLKKLRAHIDARYPNRILLAEANQWPTDAAAYFGDGDECHMNFHFPLMPRLFMSVQLEDSFPILDILEQTPRIPDGCQWATFLRNHDELTLEMVTEEDRDYMYRVYAEDRRARINLGIRRRLAPLMRGRRRLELMNALLFSLPGTPVLYYGDEIGMGDNIYLGDRDGVRTPMQWNSDRNAGFSRANPQRLYLPVIVDPEYHYEAVNVEAQQANPSSMLWWTKRLIALRKRTKAFGRGSLQVVDCDNGKVLAFVREHEGDSVLCIANLSRFVQSATLDLSRYRGMLPVEAFGRTRFRRVEGEGYGVALGPHGFYWFLLEAGTSETAVLQPTPVRARGRWFRPVEQEEDGEIIDSLTRFVQRRRWYRGKSRSLGRAWVRDSLVVGDESERFAILLVTIESPSTSPATYVVPLAFSPGDPETLTDASMAEAVVARLEVVEPEPDQPAAGFVFDALSSRNFTRWLLKALVAEEHVVGDSGSLRFTSFDGAREAAESGNVEPRTVELDQSNSIVFFGSQIVFKLLRAVGEGPSDEAEMTRFLTARAPRRLVPRSFGMLEYIPREGDSTVLGLLSEHVTNQGTGWSLALDAVQSCFDRVLVRAGGTNESAPAAVDLLPEETPVVPEVVRALATPYPALMELLARRTAELHVVLASETDDPAFSPEPFTLLYQQSIFQSARALLARTFSQLRKRLRTVPDALRSRLEALLAREDEIESRLADVTAGELDLCRIRIHGDYHLGQVLFTGDDFVILDCESEPLRPLRERRLKRSPLRDVAGLVRSLHYATEAAARSGRIRPEDVATVAPWGRIWSDWMGSVFLETYFSSVRGACFVPGNRSETRRLMRFYLLEKCIHEIGYGLDSRPEQLVVAVAGLETLLAPPSAD